MLKRPPLREPRDEERLLRAPASYHQPGIDLLFRVIDIDNILFGFRDGGRGARHRPGDRATTSTTPSATSTSSTFLAADKQKVFEGNARVASIPRLDASLKARGLRAAKAMPPCPARPAGPRKGRVAASPRCRLAGFSRLRR
jgi:4-oxalmesaconate hydratase